MRTSKKQLSEYDLQAQKFVNDTQIRISKHYTGHRTHFNNDKEQRAAYSITIEREDKPAMAFFFGQSIANSYRIRSSYPHKNTLLADSQDDLVRHDVSIVAQKGGGKLNKGQLLEQARITPTDYDILTCITKSDPGLFDDFCDDFGYDNDSIKAQKTYFAVQQEWNQVRALFNETELEQLAEIN